MSKIHLGESIIPTNSAEYILRDEFTTPNDKEKINFIYMQILLSLRMLSIKDEVFGHLERIQFWIRKTWTRATVSPSQRATSRTKSRYSGNIC